MLNSSNVSFSPSSSSRTATSPSPTQQEISFLPPMRMVMSSPNLHNFKRNIPLPPPPQQPPPPASTTTSNLLSLPSLSNGNLNPLAPAKTTLRTASSTSISEIASSTTLVSCPCSLASSKTPPLRTPPSARRTKHAASESSPPPNSPRSFVPAKRTSASPSSKKPFPDG